MKGITEFFKREEKKRIIKEEPYFKSGYLRYYTRKFNNGSVEFWAFPTTGIYSGCMTRDWDFELREYGTKGGFYLGKIVDDEVVKPDSFYKFPMPIQRGALKLFKQAGFYE